VLFRSEYRQKDLRVKYVINAKNKGYNKNFEYAFSLATADHIAISDQDDIWELHKIETMMNNWLPGSLLIYSLSGTFRDNDLQTKFPPPNVHYAHISHTFSHVFGGPIHGHACMLKKELIRYSSPFPPDIFYDAWFSMHAISRGVIGYVPHILTWHRVHEKNSSNHYVLKRQTRKK